MGDLLQQMAETVVANEQEQPERLEKTDCPRGSSGVQLAHDADT